MIKTELLLELLAYVHKNFPYVERITSYGTAKDVLAKSEEDLKALAAAGLETVSYTHLFRSLKSYSAPRLRSVLRQDRS